MTTQARHVRWFLAFLVALFAAVVGLFSAAPASGAPAAYTYDTTPDGYDALADSSTAHASFGAARGSPAGSEVISWASHVSTGRLGVAANTGDALLSTASSGAGRSLPMNMETVCGMACKFGRLGALASAGATETISHDPIGSPVDLIKSTGAIARSYDYAPFGTPR
ncbi:MAG TPA: hypothetical protein VGC18_07495, partial [Lacisediminihabitans sp.]|uniref:hypothetical protein n=1 Tax=Lacisediminihabitans sp. TaxID=2787631 RepID=UPI002EDB10F2